MVLKVEDLDVFKMAHNLTILIYKITEKFPKIETFGIISQMRRAAYSVCANLMEGGYRNSTREFRYFVSVANGSIGELKYYTLLAKDLGYISNLDYENISKELNSISKMLRSLSKSLKNKINFTTNTNTNTNTSKKGG